MDNTQEQEPRTLEQILFEKDACDFLDAYCDMKEGKTVDEAFEGRFKA